MFPRSHSTGFSFRLPLAVPLFLFGLVGALASCDKNCAGVGLSRVLPGDTTIAVGQSFVIIYQDGGTCGGRITDANYHTVPTTGWYTPDTLIVRVDSVTGRVTGRAVGTAHILNPRVGVVLGGLVHVQ